MLQPLTPDSLGERFTVAEALRVGVSPGRLRNRNLDRPFHGVRSMAAAGADGVDVDRFGRPRAAAEQAHLRRALDYAIVISPHAFFSHVTAALWWSLPVPLPLLDAREVDVAVLTPHRPPRGRGVRGHQAVRL